jgi:hypothetical protein
MNKKNIFLFTMIITNVFAHVTQAAKSNITNLAQSEDINLKEKRAQNLEILETLDSTFAETVKELQPKLEAVLSCFRADNYNQAHRRGKENFQAFLEMRIKSKKRTIGSQAFQATLEEVCNAYEAASEDEKSYILAHVEYKLLEEMSLPRASRRDQKIVDEAQTILTEEQAMQTASSKSGNNQREEINQDQEINENQSEELEGNTITINQGNHYLTFNQEEESQKEDIQQKTQENISNLNRFYENQAGFYVLNLKEDDHIDQLTNKNECGKATDFFKNCINDYVSRLDLKPYVSNQALSTPCFETTITIESLENNTLMGSSSEKQMNNLQQIKTVRSIPAINIESIQRNECQDESDDSNSRTTQETLDSDSALLLNQFAEEILSIAEIHTYNAKVQIEKFMTPQKQSAISKGKVLFRFSNDLYKQESSKTKLFVSHDQREKRLPELFKIKTEQLNAHLQSMGKQPVSKFFDQVK